MVITLSFIDENGIKSVFVYKSSDDEVQTNAIIDGLFERGVKVYIPKISGDMMRLSVISKKSKFVRNIFGIFETTDDGEDFFDAELNIVPLVAFDKTLTRLGHGKGYYDRFLSNFCHFFFFIYFLSQFPTFFMHFLRAPSFPCISVSS